MIILGNTLIAFATILGGLLQILTYLIIARVILSWVNADPYNVIVRFIIQVTQPVMNLFSRWRLTVKNIDLTPIVILVLIVFIQTAVVGSLYDYGQRIKISENEAVPAQLGNI